MTVSTRIYRPDDSGVSLLGFGTMRFPVNHDGSIDFEQTRQMVDRAYRAGVNYFDTAYCYHDGKSEAAIGRCLSAYPRESYFLADKMPSWIVESLDHAKEIFEEQFRRCGVDYFDFYLLHSITGRELFDRCYLEYGVMDYLKEQQAAGRIKRLGFSFHSSVETMEYLLENWRWDFAQIQLNYLDWDDPAQQSGKLYELLERHNVQCIVMEPVRGGMLARLNPEAEKVLRDVRPDKSIASWAMRFAASRPDVLTVLSGMSNEKQVEDNLATMTDFEPLSGAEQKSLAAALELFKRNPRLSCTGCRYCMPCPRGVDIPGIFGLYSQCVTDGCREQFRELYESQIPDGAKFANCVNCHKCENSCPQQFPILNTMHRLLN